MRSPTERIARDAILAVFALVLSYLESLVPLSLWIPLPGIRLGLPNVCVMLAFFLIGKGDALCLTVLRVLLSTLLFSSPITAVYSLAGGLFAYCTLLALKKGKEKDFFSLPGVSAACAAAHITAQVLAASALYGNPAFLTYLPAALCLSLPTGLLTGWLTSLLEKRVGPLLRS